jgi:hypothetical protein
VTLVEEFATEWEQQGGRRSYRPSTVRQPRRKARHRGAGGRRRLAAQGVKAEEAVSSTMQGLMLDPPCTRGQPT